MRRFSIKMMLAIWCTSSICFAASALEIKLKGGVDFQSVFYRNNGNSLQRYVSANHKGMGFNSTGHVNLEIQDTIKDFMEYGGKLGIETTSKNDRRIATSIFALSDYGKIEVGTDKSAYTKMKITGQSVGVVNSWDIFTNLTGDKTKFSYVSNFGNFLDTKTRTPSKVEYSRKISYYTPKIWGFEIGISYIPDSSNNGHAAHDISTDAELAKPYKYKFAIKDGFTYSLGHEFTKDDFKIKSAIGGERGVVRTTSAPLVAGVPNPKFSNLLTYTIGSEVSYKQFAVAASYSNYMRSLTSVAVDKISRDTYLYATSVRYNVDKLSTSLTYFFSSYKKNRVNATSLGASYKVIQGLLPSAELTYYTVNGRALDKAKIIVDKSKGILLVVGVKLEF